MNSDSTIRPDQPDISIVVTHFNQPEQLANALDDILKQKDVKLEVIVVDDASDKTCGRIVESYRDKGLHACLLRQEKRNYTLAGRLLGMEKAQGRWLAFMDADDGLVSDTALSEAVNAADAANADILHFRVQAVDTDGFISHWPYAAPFYGGRLEGSEIFAFWLQNSCPAHSVWNKLYSRDLYRKVASLRHDIHIYRIEDFYLTAHFLFFARTYVSSNLLVYKYFLPAGNHLAKAAGRAFDALAMYKEFPKRFGEFGSSAEICAQLSAYLGILVTINGGQMCRMLPEDIWKWKPFELDFSSKGMKTILEYGSRRDLFFILALANASNVRKLRGLNNIINN